jgi:hypothetical protein
MTEAEAEWLRSQGFDPDDVLISEAQVRRGNYVLARDFFDELLRNAEDTHPPVRSAPRIQRCEDTEVGKGVWAAVDRAAENAPLKVKERLGIAQSEPSEDDYEHAKAVADAIGKLAIHGHSTRALNRVYDTFSARLRTGADHE